jgi:hypothetical protein
LEKLQRRAEPGGQNHRGRRQKQESLVNYHWTILNCYLGSGFDEYRKMTIDNCPLINDK